MTNETERVAYRQQATDARLAALEQSLNEVRAKLGMPLHQWPKAAR